MTKFCRAIAMSALVVVLPRASVPSASADDPRRITIMTQNLYQGTELANTLAARDQYHFLLGVAADYNNVIATNFPERAEAIAAAVAQSGPALVGLQEVALWQTQPLDAIGQPTGPWSISYDFLQILLDKLAAVGMHYTTVIARTNFDVAGVGLFPDGSLMGVSLTERAALLARTDLRPSQLRLSNPQQGDYQAAVIVPTFNGPVTIGSGWLSVDAKTRGKTFRFITTHLSALTLEIGAQVPQMQELLAGPAATNLDVVIAGDLNSTPTDPAYGEALDAGFADEWVTANPLDPGFTGFQVLPSINNPTSNLFTRIDYVLARGFFAPVDLHLIGADPSARTPSGLWPSDHAGVVATIEIDPQAGPSRD